MPLAAGVNATFAYDGDGNRVKSTIGTVTTYFVGNLYEITGTPVTKYYYAGGQRVAMKKDGVLTYMLGDHLGSTSLTTNSSGAVISELRYTPWGEVRTQSGVTATNYTYTGQYSNTNDFGLMFYNARWYDPQLGRFAQADTIVPAGVQGLDRYAYVSNNPIIYVDPSGHCGIEKDKDGNDTVGTLDCKAKDIAKWSMEYRLKWFKLFTAEAGASEWFHNIEGILEVFDKYGLGESVSGGGDNDWFSWTDAGLLESIQDGYTGKTEGAAGEWNTFFRAHEKDPQNTAYLKTLWGKAEAAGTAYGSSIAEGKGYLAPDWTSDKGAKAFLEIGNSYRYVAGLPFGGEMMGAGTGGLAGGYFGFMTCGPLCAVGGVLLGGVNGGAAGGWATYPGADALGHHPVYFVANSLLWGSK
jgi:RHS repeat-associated protein